MGMSGSARIVGASDGQRTRGQMQPSSAGLESHTIAPLPMLQQQQSAVSPSAGKVGSGVGVGGVGRPGGCSSRSRQMTGASAGHSTARQEHKAISMLVVQTMAGCEISQQQQTLGSEPAGAAKTRAASPARMLNARLMRRMMDLGGEELLVSTKCGRCSSVVVEVGKKVRPDLGRYI